jgi:hypothetical protein
MNNSLFHVMDGKNLMEGDWNGNRHQVLEQQPVKRKTGRLV